MSKDYRVNTFGLATEENALVEENLPTRAYELYIADSPTDVIAIGCDAMIVNAIALDQDSADMIFDLYSQIDGCTNETVIWLGEPKPPKELRKFFKCYDSFDAIKDKLKYLLLTAHSKSKKAHVQRKASQRVENPCAYPQASRHFHAEAIGADRAAAAQRTALYRCSASNGGMDRV